MRTHYRHHRTVSHHHRLKECGLENTCTRFFPAFLFFFGTSIHNDFSEVQLYEYV